MQIAVVGCGWLGLPLATNLQKSGHTIMATCRSEKKAKALTHLGFNAEKFELGNTLTYQRLDKLFTAQVLVLNIPVGRKAPTTEHFVLHMQGLLKHAANSQIQNIIFISTTSVYGDSSAIVTEKSPTNANTQSGQINLAVEDSVKAHFKDRYTIIRPAGLVGKDRHPANYLAGKIDLPNPNNVVNLVHQDDVIQGIESVIKKEIWGQTLVLSALEHPTRHVYYSWAAEQLNLTAPTFIEHQVQEQPIGKLIDASSSLGILDMQLKYPSPFDML